MRSRFDSFECLEGRSQKEKKQVEIGSAIAITVIYFLGLACDYGAWVGLEHPEDWGPPAASLFITDPVKLLLNFSKGIIYSFDQCAFGAPSKKPTQILMSSGNETTFSRRCCHRFKHRPLIGLDSAGRFRTTAASQYPPALCHALALALADHHRAHADGSRARRCRATSWASLWESARFPFGCPAGKKLEDLRHRSHRLQG